MNLHPQARGLGELAIHPEHGLADDSWWDVLDGGIAGLVSRAPGTPVEPNVSPEAKRGFDIATSFTRFYHGGPIVVNTGEHLEIGVTGGVDFVK